MHRWHRDLAQSEAMLPLLSGLECMLVGIEVKQGSRFLWGWGHTRQAQGAAMLPLSVGLNMCLSQSRGSKAVAFCYGDMGMLLRLETKRGCFPLSGWIHAGQDGNVASLTLLVGWEASP